MMKYVVVITYDDGNKRPVAEYRYRKDAIKFGNAVCNGSGGAVSFHLVKTTDD